MSERWLSRRGLWLAALVAAFTSQGAAQTPPEGNLQTIDGRELKGVLRVDENGQATLTTGSSTTTLELAEIVQFTAKSGQAAPVAAPHRVWLRSGLELPAMQLTCRPASQVGPASQASPAALLLKLPNGSEIALPLRTIAALRHGGDERPQPPSFAEDQREPPANNDLIYVQRDGKITRSAVLVTGCSEGRIDFELRGKEYDFELAGINAIVFGRNTGFAPDPQPRPRASVELVTGEQLTGRLLSLQEELRLQLDEGVVITAAAAAVLSIQIASDRLRWLGELTPKVTQTPAFDRVWPWTIDRSLAGPGLLLGGERYQRGLCMVPRIRLDYELAGGFDLFETLLGIDDRAGPEAHADFRIYVDDKLVHEARGRTRGMPPIALSIPLTGAARLGLEVDFGKNYDLGDYCVFANARVIRR